MSDKKKIVIVGDSLGLPREEISYEKTYPFILGERLGGYEIINSSVVRNNISKVCNNLKKTCIAHNPDFVVFHLGIVDYYPRPYPHNYIFLFLKDGLLRVKIDVDKILKKTGAFYRMSDLFNFKFVRLKKFKLCFTRVLAELEKNPLIKKIIIIGIVKPSKIAARSRIAKEEVKKYNSVLKEISNHELIQFIGLDFMDESYTIWDGCHLNEKGNTWLADTIAGTIKDYEDDQNRK